MLFNTKKYMSDSLHESNKLNSYQILFFWAVQTMVFPVPREEKWFGEHIALYLSQGASIFLTRLWYLVPDVMSYNKMLKHVTATS